MATPSGATPSGPTRSGAHPSPFTPALFDFFRELRANNRKEWFEANRDRYERDVLEPSKAFVLAFRPHLREISPHFQAEPAVRGGSLFRIHTNRRFNPDRPPYKTHAGIQFRHVAGRDVHAPGFYLHLEPVWEARGTEKGEAEAEPSGLGGSFAGMGSWRPGRDALLAIRRSIVEDPEGWKEMKGAEAFRETFDFGGDALELGPVGFDRDHPLIEDIKRKDFVITARYQEEEICAPGFVEGFAERCRTGAPFVRWLCEAVGADF